MRRITLFGLFVALFALGAGDVTAQRIASPRGEAATQIGDHWIVVDYGRPILRSRTSIFGQGDEYGDFVKGVAPVWRAGANKSTRLMTEVPLTFGDTVVPAGEYSLFVDLVASDDWTLIISAHGAKESGRDAGDGLWGSYGFTADKDVARVPMQVSGSVLSTDQFTIGFYNVTDSGGTLGMRWEHTMATVSFEIADS